MCVSLHRPFYNSRCFDTQHQNLDRSMPLKIILVKAPQFAGYTRPQQKTFAKLCTSLGSAVNCFEIGNSVVCRFAVHFHQTWRQFCFKGGTLETVFGGVDDATCGRPCCEAEVRGVRLYVPSSSVSLAAREGNTICPFRTSDTIFRSFCLPLLHEALQRQREGWSVTEAPLLCRKK